MRAKILFILLFGVLNFEAAAAALAEYGSKEAALFQQLLTKRSYDKRIKPTVEPQKQITALFTFGLARIESLDEKRQVMSSFGWIGVNWVDELLRWNATEEGVDRIIVPAEYIWLPEVAMLNSIDEGSDLTLDSDFRVSIESNGFVMWSPGFRWRTACGVDLTYFPLDRQTCEVQFINWIYSEELLNFTVMTPVVSTDSYSKNGEWDLVSAETYASHLTMEGAPDAHFPVIVLRVTLKRVPTYFLMNVVIPSVMVTFLSIVVFWLPYESGEKISLGITVLLSFSIVLLMISDVTPRNGNSLPILSWYVVATMNMAGMSLMLTISVLNIYHHSPSKPIPVWLDKLVLKRLARVLCMNTHLTITAPKAENINQPSKDDAEKDVGDVRKPAWEKVEMIADDQRYSLLPLDVLKYIRLSMEKETEKHRIEINRDQWITVGRVIDRFFLVLWFIVMSLTAAAMFPVLASNG